MKVLMAAVAALLATAGASHATPAVPLDGALGANFNEPYEDVDFAQLRRADDH